MKNSILLIILFTTTFVKAQIITGKTTNAKGETIPFANILIRGTNIGTTTDKNGNYTLETSKNKFVLVASSLGYLSERKNIKFMSYKQY